MFLKELSIICTKSLNIYLSIMYFIKKLIFAFMFNSSLLLMLIVGIQNSGNKNRVNFINNESVNLPVSFIIGLSFITGSISGSILNIKSLIKED
tara:strand:- start:118 stop:399 length:282 start_codon:yes stop_codon:yes gene_type:complete